MSVGPVIVIGVDAGEPTLIERGFLLASGAGIPAGLLLPEPRGIDVAPTILSSMDVPIPSYMDGKPLIERVLHG